MSLQAKGKGMIELLYEAKVRRKGNVRPRRSEKGTHRIKFSVRINEVYLAAHHDSSCEEGAIRSTAVTRTDGPSGNKIARRPGFFCYVNTQGRGTVWALDCAGTKRGDKERIGQGDRMGRLKVVGPTEVSTKKGGKKMMELVTIGTSLVTR